MLKNENAQSQEVLTPEVVTENQQTLQAQISKELGKFNLADAVIAQKKQEYAGLKITGIEDKEGYEKVRKALSEVVKMRTSVGKTKTHIKADYLEISRAIDGEAKRLTESILEIENPLREEKERIDAEIQAEKERAEKEAEAKLKTRVETLKASGIKYEEPFYSIGEISVDIVTLKTLSDQDFDVLNQKVILAKEKKDKEEAERLAEEKRIKDEQEKESKRLEEERKKMEQEKAEMEAEKKRMAQEKAEMLRENRASKLVAVGGVTDEEAVFYIGESGRITYGYKLLETWTDEEWKEAEQKFIDAVQKIKSGDEELKVKREAEATAKAKKEKEDARVDSLLKLGFILSQGNFVYENLNWNKEEILALPDAEFSNTIFNLRQKVSEITAKKQKEAQEKAEAEKLALLPDVEKAERYVQEIIGFAIPQISKVEPAEIIAEFRNKLKLLVDETLTSLKDLK